MAKQILQVSLPLMAINLPPVLFNMTDLAAGAFAFCIACSISASHNPDKTVIPTFIVVPGVRIPDHLGPNNLRLVRNNSLPVFSLYFLLTDYRLL